MKDCILEVKNLVKTYKKNPETFSKRKNNIFTAVNDITFDILSGEIVGLIGESGCGKTTVGRIITGLTRADSGEVIYKGKNILNNKSIRKSEYKGKIQMIFQDPATALNPQLKINRILREALYSINVKDKSEQGRIIKSYIPQVGLSEAYLERYPHELSGGQKQRICILLALLTNPEFIVADEVVSALDLSVQAQILNLLKKLRKDLNLSMLFISHDLSIIHYISDKIIVMYMGEVVESGECEQIYSNPMHPYTQLLLNSTLDLNQNESDLNVKEIRKISNHNMNRCIFSDRCPYVKDICNEKKPLLLNITNNHMVKCHLKKDCLLHK